MERRRREETKERERKGEKKKEERKKKKEKGVKEGGEWMQPWLMGASAQKGNELQGSPPHYGLTRSSQRRKPIMIDMVYWLIFGYDGTKESLLVKFFIFALGLGAVDT